ncbi:MAG: AsmA family protein [Panacagrimonas sp.]
MAKPFKIVLAVVGVLVLLIVGAVALAATFFDPNDYRGKITEAVKKETGRDLVLGDIKLSVFPWLKVRLADVSFSNAPGFGTQPMAQVREAAVGVQLMPLLLDRQVQVSTVVLDGLKLDLAKDASGKSNWDDLIKPQETTPEPDKPGPIKLDDIDISGVKLTDATVSYRDAQTRQAYRLEKLNLETGALKPGEPVDFEASVSAFAEAQKMSADLAVSATVLADLVAQKARLDGLKLDLKAKGDGLDATVALSGDVMADLATRIATVDGLKLNLTNKSKDLDASASLVGKVAANIDTQVVNIDGLKLDFKAAMKDLSAQGSLAAKVNAAIKEQRFDLKGLSLNADASGTAIPGGKQTLKLTGAALLDLAKGSLRFTEGRIGVAGLDITTSITGDKLTSDAPRLSGPISIAPFNPTDLLAKLGQPPIKTTDANVLKKASLSARYSGSFTSARFDDLKLVLDDTNAGGSFAVRDFASQAIEFALKLDRLDADRYLPPAVSGPTPAPAPADKKDGSGDLNATEIPVQALESLNASGTLDVASLKLKGATLRDVRLRVDGPKGSPKLVKLDLNAYGGQISTSTRVTPGARPGYALNTSIQAVTLGPILNDFLGKDYVTGLGTVTMDLSSGGKTVGDLRQALNGDLALDFKNGAVKGFNLAQIIRQGQALFKGQQLAATAEPPQTDFTAIGFAATIVNGVLKSDTLNASSPLFRLIGSGEIDLFKETLNYLAQPTIVATSQGQGGKGLEELAGLIIPIKLTGSLYAPKYKLDLQTALKQKAGDELRGKVADKLLGGEKGQSVSDAELKAKAGEKLNKEIGRGLEKLFGGKKKKAAEPAPDAAAPAPEAPGTEPVPAPAEPAATTEPPAVPAP